jgi:Holin of 3TMs, for gene-transfer release
MQQSQQSWFNTRWRPAMGWTYIAICIFDFMLGPVLNYMFFKTTGQSFEQWKPLTMSDGGLFHMSMGAIVGITAYSRGKEKLAEFMQSKDN